MELQFHSCLHKFLNISGEMESSQSNATGVTEDRLQLLGIVTGAFRPGVLTVVMGVTGWMF